ncbi:MAG TPA: 1-(5-phosphoribosyl)-5-[(5-phosphoribosylamino)methylideneamino]imidazole-4-carboxamide isomerase [Alphaproteobacteria bacterium]|jgi:phosphoribosylformimino-5-aminoimidazole carboxamide ribotide isomerase|nr:1-(5-phosphoribosyl)-5-[(5-phosphoribosylamino)methylideneamino]imidazole-4-carboxamide isomerase [Alphaproteobacteria bacterium]
MILYPAIDLKDGACVRLLRGDMAAVTVYNDDPAAQAKRFADAGFSWLHLVDLNGAVEGKPVNVAAVASIIAATALPVQLGGGIRSLATVEDWLSHGVTRVVLGTAAVRDPKLVSEACAKFPGRIAVSIDSRDGLVAVEGWRETSSVRTLDLALRMEECGVAAIVFTDINRDGAMGGINLDATVDLAFALTTPVIASGGVSSLEDLTALKREEKSGIGGVICGRALYDGRIDPAAALAVVNGS